MDLALLLFFLSKSLGSQAIYRQKASEPKFLGCINNQIFLPMVLRYYKIIRDTFVYNAIILKH